MPLIPAIAAAIAAGGALAQGAPSILGTPQERKNRKRLKELDDMGNAMGLTEQERRELEAEHQDAIDAAQGATDRAINAQLANGGSGSGTAIARAQAAGKATTDATTEAARDVARVDRERKGELEQELEDRLAFQSATRKARVGAVAGVPAAAGLGLLQAHNQNEEVGLRRAAIEASKEQAAGANVANYIRAAADLSPEDLEALRAQLAAAGKDTSWMPAPKTKAGG